MKKLFIYLLIASFVFTPFLAEAKTSPQEVKARGTISGLRISAVDSAAFIDNLDITSLTPDKGLILHTGTVSQSNSKISATDGGATASGGAFIDFSAGTELTDHLGKYLVYKDSAGRQIRAWIKAAGTGETVGSELCSDPGFDTPSSWFPESAAWVVSGSKAVATNAVSADGYLRMTTNINVSASALYKRNADIVVTAGVMALRFAGVDGPNIISSGNYSSYVTSATSNVAINHHGITDFTGTVDNTSTKQVLTPASTGVTLTSTKNGSTYNFEYKDPSFNYNDTSGYTYQIIDRDLSAYCDGNHQIEVYDSAGRMIKGVLGSVGTGETAGTNLITSLAQSSPAWNTLTTSGADITEAIDSDVAQSKYAVSNSTGIAVGKLWKLAVNLTVVSSTGTLTRCSVGDAEPRDLAGASGGQLVAGLNNIYRTAVNVGATKDKVYFSTSAAASDLFNGSATFSFSQVLTPSTSGAVIVSQKGGATQNFAYKNASFAYNESSYKVVIKKIKGRWLNLSGTATGIRFSAVDDTAFVDNLPAGVLPYADGKHYLRVYDSAGKYVEGVLKAVGDGETVSEELCGDPSFDTSAYWSKENASVTVSGGQGLFTNSGSTISLYKQNLLSNYSGKLYISAIDVASITSGSIRTILTGLGYGLTTDLIVGANTKRQTGLSSNGNINIITTSANTTAAINSFSVKQVLTPSASGVTIVNTISGTTYRFITKDAAFNFNDTGTLTYQVWSMN